MNQFNGFEIAIIGMAGRFPEADNLDQFWSNLAMGKNCISFFKDEEAGEMFYGNKKDSANYIQARGLMKDAERFDASFFGYTPHEALMMDPQIRILHEVAWNALEDAGYNPFQYDGSIGFYTAASANFLHESFAIRSNLTDVFRNTMLADKDYGSSRIAYRLNLKGPVFNVQTACSSSLVAVDIACKSLLNGQCSIAMAGGVSVMLPENRGYLYEEGMVFSKDGYCRPFDDQASGTVFSNGAGIVVLKRLEDAMADKDHVYAIIKGSAINNDGNQKGSYTVPSINGQADVIRAAIDMAEVPAETISYVECHGTATRIGDPVEIEGLRMAFATNNRKYCAVGSVKGNIGHLDVAAGIAGLIKTALSLHHKQLLPSIHYETSNVNIDFDNSPFYVNTALQSWDNESGPRRAGVSSFGIGGTNAHVVLEEFNIPLISRISSRKQQVLVLSAATKTGLAIKEQQLLSWLKNHEKIDMISLAGTLSEGRKLLSHSALLVCNHQDEAIQTLSGDSGIIIRNENNLRDVPKTVFMFPGEGGQYLHMAASLYQDEPHFKETMDTCFELLKKITGIEFKKHLYPEVANSHQNNTIEPVSTVPPLLFAVEYSLAQLLIHYEIKPYALIGHSLGEYAAACVAGVMSLEEALILVYHRGRLMQEMPSGKMISIIASSDLVQQLLPAGMEIAAVNSDTSCVVSGAIDNVAAFCACLEEKAIIYKILNTSCASHCKVMDPVLEPFRDIVRNISLKDPVIPMISCLTGNWLQKGEASSPDYWTNHIRKPVLFAAGLEKLREKSPLIYLELGPGIALGNFVQQQTKERRELTVNFLRHHDKILTESHPFLYGIGQLFQAGVQFQWNKIIGIAEIVRMSIPGYPFEGKEYKADYRSVLSNLTDTSLLSEKQQNAVPDTFCYTPVWRYASTIIPQTVHNILPANYLVFIPDDPLDALEKIPQDKLGMIVVKAGDSYVKHSAMSYTIRPALEQDYLTLFTELATTGYKPEYIFNMRTTVPMSGQDTTAINKECMVALYITRQISSLFPTYDIQYIQLTTNAIRLSEETSFYPLKYILSGVLGRIAEDVGGITTNMIDWEERELSGISVWAIANQLAAIVTPGEIIPLKAVRKNKIYLPVFNKFVLEEETPLHTPIKIGGTYVITGGTGGIGRQLILALLQKHEVNLFLIGRKAIPPSWCQELMTIGKVHYYAADISDIKQFDEAFKVAESIYNHIDGVFHMAGTDEHGSNVFTTTSANLKKVFSAKVQGTLNLRELAINRKFDFVILFSSIATILNNVLNMPYIAANSFLDAICHDRQFREVTQVMSINWPALDVGMGQRIQQIHEELSSDHTALDGIMESSTALNILFKLMRETCAQAVVYPVQDLFYELLQNRSSVKKLADTQDNHLQSATGNSIIASIRAIWQEYFKYDEIDDNANFFAVGGDSLIGLKFIRSYRELFKNPNITVDVLYKYPTIRQLAAWFGQGEQEDESKIGKSIFPVLSAVPQGKMIPLTYNQKRLWFISELNKGENAYNIVNNMVIVDKYDRTLIHAAFQQLILRHPALSTRLAMVDGVPMQTVLSDSTFEINFLGSIPGKEEELIKNTINSETKLPFDLRQYPLFRANVIPKASGGFELVITIHHIIADAWSFNILANDFHHIYSSLIKNEKITLPAIEFAFQDVAAWEQELREFPLINEHPSFLYWSDVFLTQFADLQLKENFRRPEALGGRGLSLTCYLDEKQLIEVKKVARLYNTSVFVILYAAFNILMASVLDQEEIICPVATSGRGDIALENMVGFLANTLLLKNTIDKDLDIDVFVHQIHERITNGIKHQNFPIDIVLDRLKIKLPQLRLFFNMQNVDTDKVHENFDAGQQEVIQEIEQEVKFDLTTYLQEYKDCLKLEFVFNKMAFKEEQVLQFPVFYRLILKKMYTKFTETHKMVKDEI